jgi:hypothetical protein
MLRLVPFRPLFRSVNRFFCSAQNTAPQATINFPEHNVNVEPQGTDMETDGEEEEVRNLLTSLYCIYLFLRLWCGFLYRNILYMGLKMSLCQPRWMNLAEYMVLEEGKHLKREYGLRRAVVSLLSTVGESLTTFSLCRETTQ